MEYCRMPHGETQAKGVRQVLRQSQRVLDLPPPLVRIAQGPQRPSGVGMATHACVLPIEERRRAVLLGIVERYPLRIVSVRLGDASREEERCPQSTVRPQQHGSVLDVLC